MTNNENNDILGDLEKKENNSLDLETLSTFLTDNELRPEELKKLDQEKNKELEDVQLQEQKDQSIIYDININSINDIISILLKNSYDFTMIEPLNDCVKVIFKKDQVVKQTLNIKYHIYGSILLQAKKISKLNLEDSSSEQKSSGEYQFENKNVEVLSRTIPGSFGETLFIKIREVQKKVENTQVKKGVSIQTAFGFLGTILLIVLILGASFLSFVVFNAQTPSDVGFFTNLGINLNDINSFLSKMTTFIFSVVILVLTIILIISLFKGILTKKDYKRKKTVYLVLSGVLLFFLFGTGTLWISLDKAIKKLPNWQEMSYGNIQIYDNDLLISKNFDKSNALITNYTNVIGPIDLKFDLTYLQKAEVRKGFAIKKYIWDFGDGQKIESQTPDIIKKFDKKGTYKIDLILEGIDSRFPDKMTQKPAQDMPSLSISKLVNISYNSLDNGGKTVRFDASDLKDLGDIEWYYKENLIDPTFQGEIFEPSKIFFEEDVIGMKIRKKDDTSKFMDKVFVVAGEKSKISGVIKAEVSYDDDLSYSLKVEKLENTPGAGFIKSFKWIIDDKEIIKEADILNLEESSQINYSFKDYGKQEIKVIITNTTGKSTQIKQDVNIPKKLKVKNQIEFYNDGEKIEDYKFDEKTREYSLFNIGSPIKLKFDAKYIRSDNPLYVLENISWDVGNNGSIDGKDKIFENVFNEDGTQEITVNYKFVHRKDKKDIIEIKDKIILELVEKDAVVTFDIKQDSEYVPVVVSFDASRSTAKDDNIVKFIYDYGDGITEERDAINPGHKYLKEGTYKIKLTVVTEKGNEFSTSKTLVLKSQVMEGKINVSMKKAPINQEIDFLSTGIIGQVSTYHWDFGDGETSNDANPSHAFSKVGEYKVKLTLEFANNNIVTLDTQVEITE